MRCALVDVKNNVITNVIVADPAIDTTPGLKLAWVPDFVNPRDAFNGGIFTPPAIRPLPALAIATSSPGI